jgi:hypothetical protein
MCRKYQTASLAECCRPKLNKSALKWCGRAVLTRGSTDVSSGGWSQPRWFAPSTHAGAQCKHTSQIHDSAKTGTLQLSCHHKCLCSTHFGASSKVQMPRPTCVSVSHGHLDMPSHRGTPRRALEDMTAAHVAAACMPDCCMQTRFLRLVWPVMHMPRQ